MKSEKLNTFIKKFRSPLMWAVLAIEIILPFMLYIGLQTQTTWLAVLSGGLLLIGLTFLIVIK